MQACPYDALYIDPQTETAAKCNFCAHRVEVGLEPPCVTVCPTQAIVAGDLDDPTSRIAQLIGREPVQVRKPEKGTRPSSSTSRATRPRWCPRRRRRRPTTCGPQAPQARALPTTVREPDGRARRAARTA